MTVAVISIASPATFRYGILSIEKIVHKYGGRYSISTEDQIFTMNIVLPAAKADSL